MKALANTINTKKLVMQKQIYVNLPIKDLKKTMAFLVDLDLNSIQNSPTMLQFV